MNTKTFAQQSRNLLMDGVAKKLLYWGFDNKGEVLESPQAISGGYSFRGEVFDDPNVPQLWQALKKAVQRKGIEVVVEEAAYTWFNRMMAIRIMAKNGYDQAQLEYAEGLDHTPIILQKARQGQHSFLNATEQQRLKKIIGDYSKDQEAFALLLVSYCHHNTMLNTVFGKIDDYTELLLPDNMLQDSGFLHLLNTTDAISDAEYREVELIGWLYQFYISEKKDEVFASFKKKKKAEAKDIPAATQIFTPNWIVKYMVENTAGKIWLDKKPDSPIKSQMKYLVENESDGTSEPIIGSIEELTLIDPACGSAHILVEGFDLLYQMYMEEYYAPEEAVECILKKNLFGLDIDDRAAQLATFAILLKAATKYRDVFTKGWLPNVYAMPEALDFSLQDLKDFLGEEGHEYVEELDTALRLMKQAKNLGSVMKLSLSQEARDYIQERFINLSNDDYLDLNLKSILQGLKNYIPILLILTNKYAAVVANPPYMGQSNMNGKLKNYINSNYPIAKSDLYTVMIERIGEMVKQYGSYGLITPPSWLFTISYAKLRDHILSNHTIQSLLNFGRGVFGADFGSVSFVISKFKDDGTQKVSCRSLFRGKSYVDSVKQKEDWFFDKDYNYYTVLQSKFDLVPNKGLAYWIPAKAFDCFVEMDRLSDLSNAKVGLQTSDNNRFRRNWQEVSVKRSSFINNSNPKWIPYNSGGEFRKWYGNQYYVINWENDGEEIKSVKKSVVRNEQFYKQQSISWSKVTIGGLAFRYFPEGFIFDVAGCSVFNDDKEELFYLQGVLNSKLKEPFVYAITQSVNYEVGIINNFPINYPENEETKLEVINITKENIQLAKKDWDKSEVSWNFSKAPLTVGENLEDAFNKFQSEVKDNLLKLYRNETKLNEILLKVYDLENEFSSTVPLKEITLYQDIFTIDYKSNSNPIDLLNTQEINKEEVIQQFISYGIGLFMGRYRLDKPGLNIAHPNPTTEELESYTYINGKVIIDEDAILPLMGKNCNFPDDALQQFQQLLDTIWGHESRTENVNFIQECLDKTIEKFLVKDFYKYHCSMYKKKPIYWLFASPKGAFQVLVYMHRMNAFTVEKIRANYLLEHIKNLRSEESVLLSNESNLSTQEAKRLDQIRKDITECETYDLELKDIADQQIEFDLDDGITVNYEKFKTVVAKIN
jgi:Eco57I restriction-modification methylase